MLRTAGEYAEWVIGYTEQDEKYYAKTHNDTMDRYTVRFFSAVFMLGIFTVTVSLLGKFRECALLIVVCAISLSIVTFWAVRHLKLAKPQYERASNFEAYDDNNYEFRVLFSDSMLSNDAAQQRHSKMIDQYFQTARPLGAVKGPDIHDGVQFTRMVTKERRQVMSEATKVAAILGHHGEAYNQHLMEVEQEEIRCRYQVVRKYKDVIGKQLADEQSCVARSMAKMASLQRELETVEQSIEFDHL